jgi:ABC-type multidrug transport system ATPase subunit
MTDSRKILLKVQDLSLSLSRRTLLHQVNLNLLEGDIYGLLGPNGAGKTTLFKAMTGLLWPMQGSIKLFENPITPLRKKGMSKVGSLIGSPQFYEFLTARQHLEFMESLRKSSQARKIDEILAIVGLEKRANEKIACYSDGMKQRLAIAQALVGNTEILILDEPFRGLDSIGIKDIWQILLELNRNHFVTILFSSHVISIAETHCNRIGIIHHGNMLFEGSKEKIRPGAQSLENAYLEFIHSQTSIAVEGRGKHE